MEGRQDRLWGWPIFRFLKIWRQASLSYRQRLRVNGSRVYLQIIYDTLLFLSEKVLTVQVALSYTIWYSAGRFFIEGLRTDSLWIGDFLRVSQGLSLLLFVGAIGIWIYRRRDYPPKTYYLEGWNLKGERD